MKKWPIFAGLGAGAGAFLLYGRFSYASEDTSGETLPPEQAKAVKLPAGTPASLGSRAVEVGLKLVGVKEEPKGSNRGDVVDQINRGVRSDAGDRLLGKPWCARFVRYCYEKAADETGKAPPFQSVKDTLAAVSSMADVFKGYETEPKPGAAALIKSKIPGGGWKHATMVVSVDGDRVKTVEGNHNDQVAVVTRPKSDFAVFLDVDRWASERNKPAVAGELGAMLAGLDIFAAGV